jgi:hypothetical protein
MMMCGPLRAKARITSGLWTPGKTKLKLHFPPRKSSRAKDLMMHGLQRSMSEIPSRLWAPVKSIFKLTSPMNIAHLYRVSPLLDGLDDVI